MGRPRLLLAILALGVLGTLAELLLLEHTEDTWQWTPIVLLALGWLVLGWEASRPGRWSRATLRVLMLCYVVAGVGGLYLHYRGNVEFELEMSPGMAGWELFSEAMMGATPALAPGAMILFGLLGLLVAAGRRDHASHSMIEPEEPS